MRLEPPPDELKRWSEAALDLVLRYQRGLRDRRIAPATTSAEIRQKFDRALPEEGVGFPAALREYEEQILPLARHNGHPRMFGYVQSPGVAVASLGDLLASALNANLTSWRSAPGPAEIERLTIEWIRQMVGADPAADGLFVSGGSMANLSALAVARRLKAPIDLAREGAHALPRAMRLYVSPETHHSMVKAATLLGLGRDHVREVPVDGELRMRPDALEELIEEDARLGHQPFCVVGTAGTVGTGAIDPLDALADVAERHGLWFHVDGSYGGFAVLATSAPAQLRAMSRADSIALDPHKWLYLPVDCGCVLYRDPQAAFATFAHQAEYMRVMDSAPAESFAFWDYGPELSRRFRALKVWMLLRAIGLGPLRAAIGNNLACAAALASKIDRSGDFERLAPVELSIVCFRHVPAEARPRLEAGGANRDDVERRLDAWNERLLVALQRDGSSYMSNAPVAGRFALRACIMNHRTTLEDMDVLLADLRRLAAALGEF
jgi:glutamate/tyrosine decarboxylase-like PLP-dependent enzyme